MPETLAEFGLSFRNSQATGYGCAMIASFRHGGLKALYEGKTALRLAPTHVARLRDIVGTPDLSQGPDRMNLPGFRLHALKGPLKGHWAVRVSGNLRVTFRFEDGAAANVN